MIEVKKGDKVILKGFTGIKLGVFEVQSVTKKTLTIVKKNGDELIFDKKTGKQVNVVEGKEKYANSVIEDDGSYVAPSTRGKAKKTAKKSTKKATKSKKNEEIVEEDDEEDDEEIVEEDDEEEEIPKAKKPTKKKSKKKPEPEPEEEDNEDDEDDWEEVEDDD